MTAAVRLAATPGTLRKSWRYLLLAGTHAAVAALGFAAGIYTLPILTAPAAPPMADVQAQQARATWRGEFRRDLRGSDLLHWGEGAVTLGPQGIAFAGRLAPGPDYKLYLSPEFVETEADFQRLKPRMVRVGDVRTFDGFLLPLPPAVDPAQFDTVIVWCESFAQFITAARYR